MAAMTTFSGRTQARHSGLGLLAAAPARLSGLVGGGDRRHRHNQPLASAC